MKKSMTFGGLIICFGNLCFSIHAGEKTTETMPIAIGINKQSKSSDTGATDDSGIVSGNSSAGGVPSPLVQRAKKRNSTSHRRSNSWGEKDFLSSKGVKGLTSRRSPEDGIYGGDSTKNHFLSTGTEEFASRASSEDGIYAGGSESECEVFEYESDNLETPTEQKTIASCSRIRLMQTECLGIDRLKRDTEKHQTDRFMYFPNTPERVKMFEELKSRVRQRELLYGIWTREDTDESRNTLSDQPAWMIGGVKFDYCRKNILPIPHDNEILFDRKFMNPFKELYCGYVLLRIVQGIKGLKNTGSSVSCPTENEIEELKKRGFPCTPESWTQKFEVFKKGFSQERTKLLQEAQALHTAGKGKESDQKIKLIEMMNVLNSRFGEAPANKSYAEELATEARKYKKKQPDNKG